MRKSAPSFIIFSLILFHGINNYIWLQKNLIPPFWDESKHLIVTLKYLDSIRASFNILEALWRIDSIYPPFFNVISLPIGLVWGSSLKELAMTNIIFLFILLFSVYKIGELFFDKNTGLLASFMVSMFPMVFGVSRMFLLDFSVTAMVALSIYLLIKTEYFSNRKDSIFFGISIGLGMLTKETFFIFLLGPLLYILYKVITLKPNIERHRMIVNFMISFAIGSALALPFYLRNIFNYFFKHSQIGMLHECKTILWPYFVHYNNIVFYIIPLLIIAVMLTKISKLKLNRTHFKVIGLLFILILGGLYWHSKELLFKLAWFIYILKDQIGLPFLTLFFICLPFFLFSLNKKPFLFLWLLLPYFLFTFCFFPSDIRFWSPRFTLPYLPVIALISAKCLLDIKHEISRILITCLLIVLAFLQFFSISYGFRIKNKYADNKIISAFTSQDINSLWLIHRPIADDWKIPEILKWIEKDNEGKNATINLLAVTNEINRKTFSYYILANQLHLNIVEWMDPRIFDSEYIIILSNPKSWNWFSKQKRISRLYNAFREISHNYTLAKYFNLPKGTLLIYKKNALSD